MENKFISSESWKILWQNYATKKYQPKKYEILENGIKIKKDDYYIMLNFVENLKFPEYKKVIGNEYEDTGEIGFSARLLNKMERAFPDCVITMYFNANRYGVKCTCIFDDIEFFALIMPCMIEHKNVRELLKELIN
jgi:hypothetical protein